MEDAVLPEEEVVPVVVLSVEDVVEDEDSVVDAVLPVEADISQMPIEYAPQFTKMYNKAICDDLGLTPPEGYTAIEAE